MGNIKGRVVTTNRFGKERCVSIISEGLSNTSKLGASRLAHWSSAHRSCLDSNLHGRALKASIIPSLLALKEKDTSKLAGVFL